MGLDCKKTSVWTPHRQGRRTGWRFLKDHWVAAYVRQLRDLDRGRGSVAGARVSEVARKHGETRWQIYWLPRVFDNLRGTRVALDLSP